MLLPSSTPRRRASWTAPRRRWLGRRLRPERLSAGSPTSARWTTRRCGTGSSTASPTRNAALRSTPTSTRTAINKPPRWASTSATGIPRRRNSGTLQRLHGKRNWRSGRWIPPRGRPDNGFSWTAPRRRWLGRRLRPERLSAGSPTSARWTTRRCGTGSSTASPTRNAALRSTPTSTRTAINKPPRWASTSATGIPRRRNSVRVPAEARRLLPRTASWDRWPPSRPAPSRVPPNSWRPSPHRTTARCASPIPTPVARSRRQRSPSTSEPSFCRPTTARGAKSRRTT